MSWLQSFFGEDKAMAGEKMSAIDAVAYLASLASDPKEVDPLLDGLRAVTSAMKPGTPLSEDDQKKLANLYVQLETYLIERDPLRSWDKKTLDSKVTQKFTKRKSEEAAFWRAVEHH